MKKSNQTFLASLLVALFLGCGSPGDKPQENTKENEPIKPVGIKFNTETLKRLGSAGDNWCITWLKDDSQITSMCDGNWLDIDHPKGEYANLFIELPLLKTRILHWINYRYQIPGYLHRGFDYWMGPDPHAETTSIQLESGTIFVGGDNWLVYPGNRKLYSCIRLEAMRDGIA